jgi:hypothetical protein
MGVTGCATNRVADIRQTMKENNRIAICNISSSHVGSTAAGAAAAGAIFLSPAVLVSVGVAHSIDKSHAQDWPKAEPVDLDTACLRQIEAVLSEGDMFSYVAIPEARFEKPLETGDDRTKTSEREFSVEAGAAKTKPSAIQKVCADNNLGHALSTKLTYAFGVGMHKRVALTTSWTLFGADGHERITLTTSREGENRYEILPDSRDPKLQADYIQLAAESAMEFVIKLDEEAGISGEDTRPQEIAADTIPSLLTGLNAEEYFLRWRAARTLQKMGRSVRAQIGFADLEQVAERLAEMASSDPNELVRKQAGKALKKFRKDVSKAEKGNT